MSVHNTQNVIVGLSGGVDSAVAALLLLEQGYHVEALFMKNWEEDDRDGHCSAEADLKDASAVCEKLGIKLHTANFSSEYWDRVFANFLDEYRAGRTPNPDILCNKEIKFRAFLEHAQRLGAEMIATGHYAQRRDKNSQVKLCKGLDRNKDQTYFLYTLQQEQLAKVLFPIGHLPKQQVRARARAAGLPVHDKKDSTGICFIGERNFREFLQQYLGAQPGDILSVDGERLGQHPGLMYFTLGQRQGLGIGGRRDADEAPWYVVDKDLARNLLIVAQGHDHPRLYQDHCQVLQCHWVSGHAPAIPQRVSAKIRYRQADQMCTIQSLVDDQLTVSFDQAQRAVTPGQSIVFYQNDCCLGGGIIAS